MAKKNNDQLPENWQPPRVRKNYEPSVPVDLDCSVEPSHTKQEFRDECDINNIMKKYERTGELPNMIKENPIYGDFSDPIDLQSAMDIVVHAQTQFNNLDAHIRERFDNSPVKFLEFTSDPKNAQEMAKMGLMKPESIKRVTEAETKASQQKLDDTVNAEIEKRAKKPKE